MCTSSVSNVIYHKFSHGAAFYTLNGKNVNVMLEFILTLLTSRGSMLLLECKLHYVPTLTLGIFSKYTKNKILLVANCLTLKAPNKNCSRRHFNFYFYVSKEIRLNVSCESFV